MTAVVALGARELLLASALILAGAGVSLALRLGLERRLVGAALRAALQLAVLGLVLDAVFRADRAALVLALMVAMALLAGNEAVRRTDHRVRGGRALAMGVMLASAMGVTLWATNVAIRVEPWYAPQYLIPILGMLLGNTLNGVSLGFETTLAGFVAERERVEVLLAHGATRREAARDVVRRAVRTGMIPIVNAMVAAGAISIPGMMTGQILAGEEPTSAARYQVFILFCIAGGVALGTLAVAVWSARLVFDERDRLRIDRIRVLRR